MDGDRLSGEAITALILGVVAWMAFLVGFFVSSDPEIFFFLAFICGGAALALGIHARRTDAALIGAVAGQAALLATLMVALVWATGVLVFLVLFALFIAMMSRPSYGGSGCNCDCGGCSCGGCDCSAGSCCDCGTCCECGDCCECGSCCDCGCGCATIGMLPLAAKAFTTPASWTGHLSRLLAHHPDTPAYAHDVYRVGGVRLCIGCFTTYPVFLLVVGLTLAFPLPWALALAAGLVAASAQAISSAGLARRWWLKAGVKTLFGAGLALLVHGVRAAPWDARVKTLALAFALALALASAIPRARRMRAANACACRGDAGAAHARE